MSLEPLEKPLLHPLEQGFDPLEHQSLEQDLLEQTRDKIYVMTDSRGNSSATKRNFCLAVDTQGGGFRQVA